MNITEATAVITDYMDADIPPFAWGAPGVGKSDVVRAIAKERGIPVVDFRAVLRDPVDLRGLPSISDGVARWLPPSDLPSELRDGKEGIFFMDELNAASASVQAACFGLVLDRKIGEYHLPKGWRIIAAGNRQSDKAAAQRMPTALANRFAHVDIEPDIDVFTRWAYANEINPMVIAFLRFKPSLLHDMGDGRAFPTPRSWAQVSKIADKPADRLLPLVSGLVGNGAGGEFTGFVRVFKDLPSLDYVLANPEKCEIPKDTSAKYAIAIGLAARVKTEGELARAITYTSRMPAEFNVMMVTDVAARDVALSHSKPFNEWAQANQDVVFT